MRGTHAPMQSAPITLVASAKPFDSYRNVRVYPPIQRALTRVRTAQKRNSDCSAPPGGSAEPPRRIGLIRPVYRISARLVC